MLILLGALAATYPIIPHPQWLDRLVLGALALGATVAVLLIGMRWVGTRTSRDVTRIRGARVRRHWAILARGAASSLTRRDLVVIGGLTIVVWSLWAAAAWMVATSVDVTLAPWQAVFITGLQDQPGLGTSFIPGIHRDVPVARGGRAGPDVGISHPGVCVLGVDARRLVRSDNGGRRRHRPRRERRVVRWAACSREPTCLGSCVAKVVITLPAHDAEVTLARTIRDIPAGVADEVIVVDDASSDGTMAQARRASAPCSTFIP